MNSFQKGNPVELNDLASLRNKYAGRRCFVIGNGPSLNKTDLSSLRDEITIGMNRIYLKFDQIKFATSFLCCDNALVLEQFGRDFFDLPSTLLLSNRLGRQFAEGREVNWMEPLPGAGFNLDLTDGTWYSGATVTFCCLQLAYHLGCTDVILLGVDHNFKTTGTAHKSVVSAGADPNHFDSSYFGKGARWQLPDLVESEASYMLAKAIFEANGRSIRDATVDGKLTIFDRARLRAVDGRPTIEDVREAAGSRAATSARPAGERARARLSELLNSEKFVVTAYLGFPLLFAGIAWITIALGASLGLQILAATFLIVVGAGLLVGSVAVPFMIENARRRRLKDSRLLRNAIETYIAAQRDRACK